MPFDVSPALKHRIHLGAAYFGPGHGGISRVARLTARALLEYGHELSLTSLHDADETGIGGIRAVRTGQNKLAFTARCQMEKYRSGHAIYDQTGVARAHMDLPVFRRTYAIWMHGIDVWHGLKPKEKRVLKGATARFIGSQYSLDRYREYHSEDTEVDVCWLATEENCPPKRSADFNGRPTVLFLARIDDLIGAKGHQEVLDAWPAVVSAVPDALLVFAGTGPGLEALKDAVARSQARSSIDVRGFVEERDLEHLWCQSHVFAMPSRKEGFGLVYIEAMRSGVPVIASIHDAGAEVNVDGETGFNVDLSEKDCLTDRLIALLKTPDLACSMGQAGRARWQRNFSFDRFADRFHPIVTRFLDR